MSKRWSGFRLVFAVLALAALSAVMAAACGGADEEAKDTAPAATQAPVVQAATAAPAMAATAAPAMAATAAPVAQVATAAPAMAATAAPAAIATAISEVAAIGTGDVATNPPLVQAILDELGLELYLPPAATTEPKFGGTMFVIGREAKIWDPQRYSSYRLRMSHSYTHLRLLRFAAGPGESPSAFVPVPSIAESWDIEDAGLKFTFHLRDGVKWHEDPPGVNSVPAGLAGREVTAQDFMFTWDRVRANEQSQFAQTKLSHTVSWEAPDDKTLVMKNDQVVAAFLAFLAQTLMEAMPQELETLCGDYVDPACSNVGNGPFMFEELNPAVSVSHVKNPNYWEQPFPYIDQVVELYFGDERAEDAAFRTGKLDIIGTDTCSISGERYRALTSSNPDLTYATFPDSLNTRGVWMKQGKPPFNDINVRRAVALSLDRVGWVKGPLGGYGLPFGGPLAYGTEFWIADNDYGAASRWLEYDKQGAIDLLAESGYGPGDIKLTLLSSPDYGERFASEAEAVTGMLNEIGMDIKLEMQDYDTFFNVALGNFESLAYTWSQIGWVPEGWFWQQFHSSQRGTTHFGINDPNLDILLDSYTTAIDPARRLALIQESAIHVVDQALNPLGPFWIYFYGQQNRIKNYLYNDEFDNAYAISLTWIDEG